MLSLKNFYICPMAFNKNPKVTTRYIDLYDYVSVNETGNEVHIDMHDGPNKKHQSPTELLLSAIASCSAVDVAEILKKRKKTFTEFSVEVRGTRREEHPRAFTHIELEFIIHSNDVKESELLKNATMVVEKYCSVATTVSAAAALTVKARILPV